MFNEEAIREANKMVAYLKSIKGVKREHGKSRLNRGRGERYGNTPVEYSIIFSVDGKFFHFFTSDMRYSRNCGAVIRTCEHARDFHGGTNHFVATVDELKSFMERELAK